MNKLKYIGMMLAAGMLTATSCSDFDDYNELKQDIVLTGNATLWENIEQNPDYSDFRDLVQSAGFADELGASNYYTLFIPKNGTFDKSAYQGLDSAILLKQFVKNHVVSYNHPLSGVVDTRVFAMNRKVYQLSGTEGDYSYAGVKLLRANIPSTNGLIHELEGVAGYYSSIYDYLMEHPKNDTLSGLDRLHSYFDKYELRILDEKNSVIGPIVNGVQTYIDSVMIINNTLANRLGADLDEEDSTYTMLMPTNKAWDDAYNNIKKNYNYVAKYSYHDLKGANGSSQAITTQTLSDFDYGYMKDSITSEYIVNNLVYNNNNIYNRWIVAGQAPAATDTMRTTRFNKMSNPGEILSYTIGEPIRMSNGWGRKVDSLVFHSWEWYMPEIDFNPARYADLITSASNPRVVNVRFANGSANTPWGDFSEKGLSYFNVEPSGPRVKPEMYVNIPNVRSGKYKFYCVFVPGTIIGTDSLPNNVNFTLNYSNAKGAMATHNFCADLKNDNPSASKAKPFNNDPTKVDTLYLGEFTFPVAYAGVVDANNNDICPNMKISSKINVFNAAQMKKYTRSLRIAAIILKPVELAEFEEKEK